MTGDEPTHALMAAMEDAGDLPVERGVVPWSPQYAKAVFQVKAILAAMPFSRSEDAAKEELVKSCREKDFERELDRLKVIVVRSFIRT